MHPLRIALAPRLLGEGPALALCRLQRRGASASLPHAAPAESSSKAVSAGAAAAAEQAGARGGARRQAVAAGRRRAANSSGDGAPPPLLNARRGACSGQRWGKFCGGVAWRGSAGAITAANCADHGGLSRHSLYVRARAALGEPGRKGQASVPARLLPFRVLGALTAQCGCPLSSPPTPLFSSCGAHAVGLGPKTPHRRRLVPRFVDIFPIYPLGLLVLAP